MNFLMEMFDKKLILRLVQLFFGAVLFAVLLSMEARLEQRSVLKFLSKSGHMPIECWRRLRDVFAEETMSKGQVRVWHKRFREGDENIKDKAKTGRPRSACTEMNCEAARTFIEDHRNSTLQDVAQELNVSITSAHRILKKDLKLSKISPKFVPKELTEEQMRCRRTMSQDNINLMKEDPELLQKIVTETRVGSQCSSFQPRKAQVSGTQRELICRGLRKP